MAEPPPAIPVASILLPTHDRPETLSLAIRSVLSQTVSDFELLVVGDGCDARSAEVVAGFDDARVRWFDLPKAPGFGYANRNRALAEARAPIVAYLAHDDLWFPDHLEQLLPLFDDPAVRIAYSRPLWVLPDGAIVPGTFNLRHPPTMARFLGRRFSALPAASVVYRDGPAESRQFWWDGELAQQGDWDLWARIIGPDGGAGLRYLGTPTTLHFKADWRPDDEVGPRVLDDWRGLFEQAGALPAGLRVGAQPGRLQQEAFAERLAAGGGRWSGELRQAVVEAVDTFAAVGGEGKAPIAEALAKAEARGVRLRAEADRKGARIERLLEKLGGGGR